MSVSSVATYSALPNVLKESLPQYLGVSEAILKLPVLNREHMALFSQNRFWLQASACQQDI